MTKSRKFKWSPENSKANLKNDQLYNRFGEFDLRCRKCIKWTSRKMCYDLRENFMHDCAMDSLVVKNEEKYFLVKPLPHKYPDINFCFSRNSGRECKKLQIKKLCKYAHSFVEREIWLSIKNGNFQYEEFVEFLKSRKRLVSPSEQEVLSERTPQIFEITFTMDDNKNSNENSSEARKPSTKPRSRSNSKKRNSKLDPFPCKPPVFQPTSSKLTNVTRSTVKNHLSEEVKVVCNTCYQKYQNGIIKVLNCRDTDLTKPEANFLIKNYKERYVKFTEPNFSRKSPFKRVHVCRNVKWNRSCKDFKQGRCCYPHSDAETLVWNTMLKYKLNSVKEYIAKWRENAEGSHSQDHDTTFTSGQNFCSFCDVQFREQAQLEEHIKSKEHKENYSLVDDNRQWHFEPPPRVKDVLSLKKCKSFEEGRCKLKSCPCAHGEEMLQEWIERFEIREMMKGRGLYDHSYEYINRILFDIHKAKSRTDVLKQELLGITIDCDKSLNFTTEQTNVNHKWTFSFKHKKCQALEKVALLRENVRHRFFLTNSSNAHTQVSPGKEFLIKKSNMYYVVVEFKANIPFGTYRQSVVFDFGKWPKLEKCLLVDIGKNIESLVKFRREFTNKNHWNESSFKVIKSIVLKDSDEKLLKKFPLIAEEELLSTEFKKMMNHHVWLGEKNVYKDSLLKLIQMEHYAFKNELSKYNVETEIKIIDNSSLSNEEKSDGIFLHIPFCSMISEDTPEGRILNYMDCCNSIWLRPHGVADVLFEAKFSSKKLSAKSYLVAEITDEVFKVLKSEISNCQNFRADIQFQVNDVLFAKMSEKVFLVTNDTLKFLFPSPSKFEFELELLSIGDADKLDDKQRHLVKNIISETSSLFVAPLLVYGPFGMGKTFTLSQAIIQLIKRGKPKILVCTRSNSGADLYLTEYLYPALKNGTISASFLRLYSIERLKRHIPKEILKDCRLDNNKISLPTIEEMNKCEVIVTTFSMCMHLCNQRSELQHFTHIFIDEAAQVIEVDMLPPLLLADPNTRIIMAGDILQLEPPVFSKYARAHGFNVPTLKRLYILYEKQRMVSDSVVTLTNNYRSSQPILDFLTDNIYHEYKIHSPKRISPHPELKYSLYFSHVGGKAELNQERTSYYNLAECYEVIEQMEWLENHWPLEWNTFNWQNSVCVIVPYSKQRSKIRKLLDENGFKDVDCQLVRNIQGKEYRAIVISMVRTYQSCDVVYKKENNKQGFNESALEFGFFSNNRTLNTAFSRARSLIICVGDARAMIKFGDNKCILRAYIKRCLEFNTIQSNSISIDDLEQLVDD